MIEEIISFVIKGAEQFLLKSSLISTLFVIMLIMPYSFKNWSRVLMISGIIVLGFLLHSTLLSFDLIAISPKAISFTYWAIIGFLFILCFYRLVFAAGRNNMGNRNVTICYVISFFFGMLNSMYYISSWGNIEGDNMFLKFLLILSYTLGVFIALLLISILYFLISYILQIVLRFTQKEWLLIIPSIAMGILISEVIAKI